MIRQKSKNKKDDSSVSNYSNDKISKITVLYVNISNLTIGDKLNFN
jgi:hypothetical protein